MRGIQKRGELPEQGWLGRHGTILRRGNQHCPLIEAMFILWFVLFYLLIIYSIISILPSCFFPTSISFNFRTISQSKAWLFPFHNWGRIYSDRLLHRFKAVIVPCSYYLFLKKQGQQVVGGKGFRLHGLHNFLWVFHSVLNKNLHIPLKIEFSFSFLNF